MATGPDEAEPVTFAATAIPEAEPEVQIVEAVAIDEASPALEPGVTFTREQLEVHASGRISEIFGPAFAAQDRPAAGAHAEPPLLLADRVVGIDAAPASHAAPARIWTETDVRADSWYLARGPHARRHHDRGGPGRPAAHQLARRRLHSTAASASTACSAAS